MANKGKVTNWDSSNTNKGVIQVTHDNTLSSTYINGVLNLKVTNPTVSDGINKIITPCGTLEPVDRAIKLTMAEGLETNCTADELTTKLKVPVATNLGGTGLQQYNKGDVLIGKEDGTLEKLQKGSVGQVLGIKENDSIGYIPINVDVPIKKFSISPCGDLTPNNQGKIGLELNDGFTCELNQDKNIAKIGIKPNSGDIKAICLNSTSFYSDNNADAVCVRPDKNGLINFEAGDNVSLEAMQYGLKISAKTGGGGGQPNYIVVRDKASVHRVAENNTIYIVKNIFGRAQFFVPETAKVGWWFGVMGIISGFAIRTPTGKQAIFYNGKEYTGPGQGIESRQAWHDAKVICYEENSKFKLRFFFN